MSFTIRQYVSNDIEQIHAIYAHHVINGTASFELEPPTLADMTARVANILEMGLPWLVAEIEDEIIGYTYAGLYRPCPAYGNTVENSAYLTQAAKGTGVGAALMKQVIDLCTKAGRRQMVTIMVHEESINFHKKLGFEYVGVFKG
jgi:L-amino acid N-acyltransferase YncA